MEHGPYLRGATPVPTRLLAAGHWQAPARGPHGHRPARRAAAMRGGDLFAATELRKKPRTAARAADRALGPPAGDLHRSGPDHELRCVPQRAAGNVRFSISGFPDGGDLDASRGLWSA